MKDSLCLILISFIIVFQSCYSDSCLWRAKTIDNGDGYDLEFTATDGTNGEETIVQMSGSFTGRPALKVNGIASADAFKITGGSDLSEYFDISGNNSTSRILPGMVVCIDPHNSGKLKLSANSYDQRVAGIVSGAKGIKPGMMMGQEGTIAYGRYPVALSGRVYCWVDTSNGMINPGDLLTTSSIPGHAMKVKDYEKSKGAILGKAMTGYDGTRGLVLVLVTLQ